MPKHFQVTRPLLHWDRGRLARTERSEKHHRNL